MIGKQEGKYYVRLGILHLLMSVKFNKTDLDRLIMTTPENYIRNSVCQSTVTKYFKRMKF